MSARLLVAVAKSGLPRQQRAILAVLAEEVRDHGLTWQVSLETLAERIGCHRKSVQRHLPALVSGGYVTRRDVYHHAAYLTVTDPALWPARHCDTDVYLDKKYNPDILDNPDKKGDEFPVLNTSPEVTNVTSVPAVAATVVGEGESKVVCLEKARADLEPRLDPPATKPKRARKAKARQTDDGESFVSDTGHRLAHVRDLYHRYCCTPEGEDDAPEDMARVFRLNARRQKAFNELCLELGAKASYQWFGMWFRWAHANRWANGTAEDCNGWQGDFDWLLKVETVFRARERKYRRHDPAGYLHELEPSDDPIPAPANDHLELRHAVG